MTQNDDSKLTPMMRQYQEVKADIPKDAVLLFRLGDFSEMFFEDAQIVSPILDIALTKRAGYPMCGIPYHALDNYLPKLIEAGVKVAIAEQTEDPKLAKGIVKRAVTRIITPGTVMDSSVLQPGRNNFLTAIFFEKNKFGLACLDISTGDFRMTEIEERATLETELFRLRTKECLIPESLKTDWTQNKSFPNAPDGILWTSLEDWIFSFDNAEQLLKHQFQVLSLDGFGCKNMNAGIAASGALLHYSSVNLRSATGHIRKIRTYSCSDYLVLDQISQKNLELVEPQRGASKESTLLYVLDNTVSPMGSRMLREWILRPLRSKQPILERLDAVSLLKEDPVALSEIRELISSVRDMERITARINTGAVSPRDMNSLSYSLEIIPGIKDVLYHFDTPLFARLMGKLHDLKELRERIRNTVAEEPPALLSEGGYIRTGCNPALDELRMAATEGKNWVAALQAKEQERTGIKSLKVQFNKVFGYYIEISKSNLQYVPDDYIRKQTLVNAERFITPDLKEIESKILGSEDKSKALEAQIFQELREFAQKYTGEIQESASALAETDAIASLAECAIKHAYIRPKITEDTVLDLRGGRHPVLDAAMKGERFVPNDTLLDGEENRMMIITGPNMAGKSTYIRQTALLVIMAQAGSFVPAAQATVGLVDRIFTRVGAGDDISRGQSTFMVEMVETANILNNATPKSLVILDEIGRGTSTFDGISIAWAVAEFLHNHPGAGSRTLFATHYHELTELALTCKGVKNYNVAVKEYGDQIIFLRQIVPGATDKSYGIHVARLAGLPQEVVKRAYEILDNLETNAIAEEGEPSLTIHREGKAKEGRSSYKSTKKGPFHPSLFDSLL